MTYMLNPSKQEKKDDGKILSIEEINKFCKTRKGRKVYKTMTNNDDLYEKLKKYAYQISNPFCYSCYTSLKVNRCHKCGSDDLMREVKGNGVEYGVDWIIKDILENEFTAIDIEEHTEELLNSCYEEPVKICGYDFGGHGTLLKQLDPVAFRCAVCDEQSNMFDDTSNYFTLDENNYYNAAEIENFLDLYLKENEETSA